MARQLILMLLIVSLVTACSSVARKESANLRVQSADFAFIDDLFSKDRHPQRRDIDVWLSIPDGSQFTPPYPSVVLLHSSWGLSSQEWFYAEQFRRIGIATFIIDSFTPRGVEKTSMDQTLVSTASMLMDAYSVLRYIHEQKEFSKDKVAVMGFSKGGIVALYAAFDTIQRSVAEPDLKFAAHIAYYPWCGLQLNDMHTTGAPILIQGGSKDIVTPIAGCKELVKNTFSHADQQSVVIKEHPSALHAFDHPVLARIPWTVFMDAQIPAECSIRQTDQGDFIEFNSGVTVTRENFGQVLHGCSHYKGMVKYNRRAAREALELTIGFLGESILSDPALSASLE